MEVITFISIVFFIHGAIYFIDQILKSCVNLPYMYLLDNLGINISPFQLNFFATIFNRSISKFSLKYKGFLKWWFSIGAVIVSLLLVPSVYLILKNIVIQLNIKKVSLEGPILQPVVPGINLPAGEFPYYFFTLFFTSIIHEIGHAAASFGEDVPINGIGFMILFVLPAAYVDLPSEPVLKLSPFRQLKVFCAGVWHNLVLVFVVYAIGIYLPKLTSFFYYNSQGVMVLDLDKDSPAKGPLGLIRGDIIKSVNYCDVSTYHSWKGCLVDSVQEQMGFCISLDVVNTNDETVEHPFGRSDSSVECCNHNDGTKLCFELRQSDGDENGIVPMQPYSCLPARIAVTSSNRNCVTSSQCDTGWHCLSPALRNTSRLLYIVRQNTKQDNVTPSKNVLFLGPPGHLFYTVTVTDYVPKYNFLPIGLPSSIETLIEYLIKFSAGLAVLNLVPCFYLDGYRIMGCLVEIMCYGWFNSATRRIIHNSISFLGSTLLVSTIVLGIYVMVY